MPQIISIGECMIELYSDKPLDLASSFNKSYAGDTINMLHMASKLGSSTGYLTRLGDDPFAEFLIASCKMNNIDVSEITRVDGFTAIHFISLLEGGEREFIFYRKNSAASTMIPEDLNEDYIKSSRIFHSSGIAQAISPTCRKTVLRGMQIAKKHGVKISFDTNLRLSMCSPDEAKGALDEVIEYVDIIFASHPDETKSIIKADSPEEAIDYFHQKGISTIAITMGEEGALVSSPQGVYRASSIAPKGVSDTTGAGDAFVGAFLHCLVNGLDTKTGLQWGVAAAGIKVGGRGGIISQPTLQQVQLMADNIKVKII
tara:strand:- start:1928 stop:2872 length:945 start_codon:yes stop_codon:yes gene_type:complete